MPAYNHADFITESVQSVISQDFSDLELLIGDDGSHDDTFANACKIRESRIKLFRNPTNQGAALALSKLVDRASGKYVAVINSDDAWLPGKLAKQVEYLENHPEVGACFGRPRFFDRSGHDLPKSSLSFGGIFDAENRSRGAWLRHFFLRGNCLCHPTVVMRRDLLLQLGHYDNRLRQLPDFDMWIRFAKLSSFHIMNEELIRFRVLPGENASAITRKNSTRILNEQYFIAQRFFDGISAGLLREGFHDMLTQTELPTQEHIDIETAFIFLRPQGRLKPLYSMVALSKLHELLGNASHREIMRKDYNFTDFDLHKLASEVDTLERANSGFVSRLRVLASPLRNRAMGWVHALNQRRKNGGK